MQKRILVFCFFAFLMGCSDGGEVDLLKPYLFGGKSVSPGSLQVNSSPQGAKVYVGMIFNGTTPLLLENVSPGDYIIEIFLENYQCWSDVVKIKSNELETVQANLTSGNPLSVTVTSAKRKTTPDGYPAIEWKYKFDCRNYLSNMRITAPDGTYWSYSKGQVDGNVEYSYIGYDYSRPPSGSYTLSFTGIVPDSEGVSYSLTRIKYIY